MWSGARRGDIFSWVRRCRLSCPRRTAMLVNKQNGWLQQALLPPPSPLLAGRMEAVRGRRHRGACGPDGFRSSLLSLPQVCFFVISPVSFCFILPTLADPGQPKKSPFFLRFLSLFPFSLHPSQQNLSCALRSEWSSFM